MNRDRLAEISSLVEPTDLEGDRVEFTAYHPGSRRA
jgi:hypothetical protein